MGRPHGQALNADILDSLIGISKAIFDFQVRCYFNRDL